jgi:hypothetical protein
MAKTASATAKQTTTRANTNALLACVSNDELNARIALHEHNIRMREELALDEVTGVAYGDGVMRIELADGTAINLTTADCMRLTNMITHCANQNLHNVLADMLCQPDVAMEGNT